MTRLKRILAVIMAVSMLAAFSSCKSGKGKTSSNSGDSSLASDGASSDVLSGTSDVLSGSGSSGIVSGKTTSVKPGTSKVSNVNNPSNGTANSSGTTKVFYVENFGAKGDGVTDDGKAVYNAVKAAAEDGSPLKIVQFKANKTYRLASAPASASFKRVINVANADNIKIQGNNTKLLMKAPYRVAVFSDSSNIEFSGFIIDYSPKPFTLGKVTAVNAGSAYIEFSTNEELGFSGEVSPPSPYFAFRNRKDERRHFNIAKMQKLDTKKYRFYFNSSNVNLAQVGEDFILPIYGSSHNIGGLFDISNVTNFEMKNVTVYAMPDFGFGLRENKGYTKFTNIKIQPEPGSPIYLASWRDGFHVKDNYSKLTWDSCYIGPLGDDAFNLSSVICNVDAVNTELRTITMIPTEAGTTREGLKPGVELVAYNMKTGESIGTAKIASVLPANEMVCVKIDRDLPKLSKGCQVAFYLNQDFSVKNSYIEGTVRVRTSGLFQNCDFNVFWVRVENESYIEGPVPKDITFSGCTFRTPYTGNPEIFHVGTQMASGVGGTPQYKCKNIVLQGCKFVNGKYGADAGNELFIR